MPVSLGTATRPGVLGQVGESPGSAFRGGDPADQARFTGTRA